MEIWAIIPCESFFVITLTDCQTAAFYSKNKYQTIDSFTFISYIY
ncbi:hypothetical protein NC99_10990 [Sunxiuqinia dokdonensis]|uniref:Uncharacterized protein n=1 Tax=Sunxiuqinia dokdonensis TaxID=1409788 RepID=A0A0L8VC97_9BACT|nr:hypothetical protein NC99_10990 [Sunxiuqinia dokdonensis]